MIKITLCMVVILVVNVSLINADWQSAGMTIINSRTFKIDFVWKRKFNFIAEAACQKVEGTVLPGIPTQISMLSTMR